VEEFIVRDVRVKNGKVSSIVGDSLLSDLAYFFDGESTCHIFSNVHLLFKRLIMAGWGTKIRVHS
jgi:hypothetical protein